jgi:hypothetical protein
MVVNVHVLERASRGFGRFVGVRTQGREKEKEREKKIDVLRATRD